MIYSLHMYNDFYKLTESPFNITADPDFFYPSVNHAEAFSNLLYGISHRKGIMLITGEVGTGKTTLCRALLNRLDKKTKSAFILNPSFSDIQLLQFILKDLGITSKARNKFALIDALNTYLLEESNQGNNVVLIIDESQNLKVKQLEQIRLLSNLETTKEKLLQIILVGQPELTDKLLLPELRQLKQRITVCFNIKPLDRTELQEYIQHRLKVANSPQNFLCGLRFTSEAVDAIYNYSLGTPRMINILCDRALLAGFIEETGRIDEHIIHKCAEEVVA